MAYNYNNTEDDGKTSGYNSAMFKMKRLDDIQSLLNEINGNLLAFNQEYGVYNYQLKFSKILGLYNEVESKLTKKERKDAEKLIECVQELLDNNNVYELKQDRVFPYKKSQKLNEHNWRIIRKALLFAEKLFRNYIDEHGMDTSYEDDSALF